MVVGVDMHANARACVRMCLRRRGLTRGERVIRDACSSFNNCLHTLHACAGHPHTQFVLPHTHTHTHTRARARTHTHTHFLSLQANEVFAGRIAMMGFMIAALRNFYDGAGPLAQVRPIL